MIGYFFGRRTPGDPKINKCFELTKELHDYFKATNGASCCRVLIKDYPISFHPPCDFGILKFE